MIVRQAGGFVYLIRQREHARQSGVIVAHLRPEYLGPPEQQLPILRGTVRHDDGWEDWDSAPGLREDGLPIDFMNMPKPVHMEIWRSTIFSLLHHAGPAEAAIAARHAASLQEISERDACGCDYRFQDMVEPLAARAWPAASAEEAEFLVARGCAALQFADVLSLMACGAWEDSLSISLYTDNRESHEFRIRRDGDWRMRIDPWPFLLPKLTGIAIHAVAITADETSDVRAILRKPQEHLVRVAVDYLPEGNTH